MHHLTAWRLYHLLNASQEYLLLLPPGSFGSFCFVRVPASLGPSPLIVSFCALLSRLLFCGSWLIRFISPLFSICIVRVNSMHQLTAWNLYHTLNAPQEDLLQLPLGLFQSFCFVRLPAFLGPSCGFVFLGQHFVLLASRLLWVLPHPVCFCFSVLASLG